MSDDNRQPHDIFGLPVHTSYKPKAIIIDGPLEEDEYYGRAYHFQFPDNEKWERVALVFSQGVEVEKELVDKILALIQAHNSLAEL